MKTEGLDKCIDFILNWQFLTIEDHHQLFLKGDCFGESHIEPLRKELIKNLVMLEPGQQANVITFYVNELNRVSLFDFIETFNKRKTEDGKSQVMALTPRYEQDDPFFYAIYHLHLLIFMEIENVCNIYNIPFLKILKNQKIDPDTLFLYHVPSEPSVEHTLPEIKLKFLAEYVQQIFEILKDFFSDSDQPELMRILKTGENSERPLLFIDNGARLADAFKQLFNCGIVRGCQKKEFEEWICNNFRFRYRNVIKSYTTRYIADIISSKQDKCQTPILNVRLEKTTGKYLITKL